MTIYDDAKSAGENASRAVVESALAEREKAFADEKTKNDQLSLDLSAANKKVTDATAFSDSLQTKVNDLQKALDASNKALDAANAEIAKLKAAQPVPTPTPTPTPTPQASKTAFGACVTNGGTLAGVGQKYGGTPPVRHFATTTVAWAATPANTSVHRSFKPAYTIADSTIDAMLKAAEADAVKNNVIHLVTFHHESDNDGLSGTALTDRIKQINRPYERKQALGLKHVYVVPVFTGGLFASYTAQAKRDLWNGVKGDLLGVDMDGVHTADTASDYATNYDDETANALKFVAANKANGFIGWTVPEFGTSRRSFDSSGAKRAAWFTKWGKHFADNGAVQVLAYDYDTGSHNGATTDYNQLRVGTPEHNAWKALVATN